jgi:hypothetical protein
MNVRRRRELFDVELDLQQLPVRIRRPLSELELLSRAGNLDHIARSYQVIPPSRADQTACNANLLDASAHLTDDDRTPFQGGVRLVSKLGDESGSRFAQWGAHLMEILEDLSVGLQRATLSVGYGTLLAERSDDGLSLLQVVPRHAGE